jgi:hypothetical protein
MIDAKPYMQMCEDYSRQITDLRKCAHGSLALLQEWLCILERDGVQSASIDGPPLIAALKRALEQA